MELPANVMIFTKIYENLNGQTGQLVAVHPQGVFEFQVKFRDREHTVLLPVEHTALIFQEPLLRVDEVQDIER